MKKISAFTIVELLVVMVLVGILSGISIAQIKNHTEAAEDAKSLQELSNTCKEVMSACISDGRNRCHIYTDCINHRPMESIKGDITNPTLRNLLMRKLRKSWEEITQADIDELKGGISFRQGAIDSVDGIGNLTNITVLYLDRNGFDSIPDDIGNMTSLVNLYIFGNNLTALPYSIGNLSNLVSINASDNNLTSLPDSIGNLSSMEVMVISHNDLHELPDNITNLDKLFYLDITHNPRIQTLPRIPNGGTHTSRVYGQGTSIDCAEIKSKGWIGLCYD